MDFLNKLRKQPEDIKKIILVVIIIVSVVILLVLWLMFCAYKINKFDKRGFIEEIGLPSLEEKAKNFPDVEMPESIKQDLEEIEQDIKEAEEKSEEEQI